MCNTSDITNKHWVHGLRNQSHEVFEVIFKTYYPSLYRLAYAYLMCKNLAEDIVQDVFVSLWTTAKSLPPAEKLSLFFRETRVFGLLETFTSD